MADYKRHWKLKNLMEIYQKCMKQEKLNRLDKMLKSNRGNMNVKKKALNNLIQLS